MLMVMITMAMVNMTMLVVMTTVAMMSTNTLIETIMVTMMLQRMVHVMLGVREHEYDNGDDDDDDHNFQRT